MQGECDSGIRVVVYLLRFFAPILIGIDHIATVETVEDAFFTADRPRWYMAGNMHGAVFRWAFVASAFDQYVTDSGYYIIEPLLICLVGIGCGPWFDAIEFRITPDNLSLRICFDNAHGFGHTQNGTESFADQPLHAGRFAFGVLATKESIFSGLIGNRFGIEIHNVVGIFAF